jgi:hypothetical protein
VYHAALLDGGPHEGGGQLFRGILRTLATALLPAKQAHQSTAQLIPFSGAKFTELSEIVNATFSASTSDRKRRQRRRKSEEILLNTDADSTSAKRL